MNKNRAPKLTGAVFRAQFIVIAVLALAWGIHIRLEK